MEKVVSGTDALWDKIILGDIRSNLKQLKLLFTLFSKIKRLTYCFLGDSTHIVNFFINTITPERTVLIDDGASTYRRAMVIVTREYEIKNRNNAKIPKLIQVTDKVFRLGPLYFENATFFTIYKNIELYSKDINITYNDYRFFKKNVGLLPIKKEIFFIGTDIRRYVLIDKEKFEDYISLVSKYYEGRKWTYILHRKENESKDKRLFMEKMANKYNFELTIFDRILEQQILHQGWIPEEIATFYSTALVTISEIYKPKITVFMLRQEDVLETSQFSLSEMRRHYREIDANIVDKI